MSHFVRDFEDYYIKAMLETAAKPAMIELSKSAPFTHEDLVDLMVNGKKGSIAMNPLLATNENFNQTLRTLTFSPDTKEFSYAISSVEQESFDTIKLNFLVNYSFSLFDTSWSKNNKPVNINVSVYGLSHPSHPSSGTIDSSWRTDANGCYANIIFGTGTCSGNIKPPIRCGDGFKEGSEECDPPDGVTCDSNCQNIPLTP
jgi:hypothetical protein